MGKNLIIKGADFANNAINLIRKDISLTETGYYTVFDTANNRPFDLEDVTKTELNVMNCIQIKETVGREYHIIGVGGRGSRIYCLYDESGEPVEYGAEGAVEYPLQERQEYTVEVPQGYTLIINMYNSLADTPYANVPELAYEVYYME